MLNADGSFLIFSINEFNALCAMSDDVIVENKPLRIADGVVNVRLSIEYKL
jgi:hypothetical protein